MSVIIKAFCYFILQITLLLSVFLLLRGHNFPGGGFIGALIASTGIGFYVITFNKGIRFLNGKSLPILIPGISCLLLSTIASVLMGEPLLTGLWVTLPGLKHDLTLGTPLIFDLGIYLTILGSLIWIFCALEGDAND